MWVCEDCTQVPIAGHLQNDFHEIFAPICHQFFQVPFQYLPTELYEVTVRPQLGGGHPAADTAVSGAGEMRQRHPSGCCLCWGAARPRAPGTRGHMGGALPAEVGPRSLSPASL